MSSLHIRCKDHQDIGQSDPDSYSCVVDSFNESQNESHIDDEHSSRTSTTNTAESAHEKTIISDSHQNVPEDYCKHPMIDHGYAWVVLFTSCTNHIIYGFLVHGFAVLYPEITDYFVSNWATTGWIGGVCGATTGIFSKFMI